MKRKKVWRYYCDYCKKAGCSGGHLKHHEERCTMNPNRQCGMCRFLDQTQSNLDEAMNILPDPEKYYKEDAFGTGGYENLDKAVEEIMQTLRDFVGNCPACILAALRQKKIPVPLVLSFDFSKECKEAWAEFNERQREADYYEEDVCQ